jgi:hypothetical protein
MKRNLIALASALLAVVAMSVIIVQAAQAKFDTLRTYPAGSNAFVKVAGDPAEPAQTFHAVTGGFGVSCAKVSTNKATTGDKATEVTGEPVYTECKSTIGGEATVEANGCHYLFTGETDSTGHAAAHVICPAGKAITIKGAGLIISIPEQTLRGIHYANETTSPGTNEREMHITLTATVEDSIKYTCAPAFACSLTPVPTSGTEGTYKGKVTVTGKEDNEGNEGASSIGLTYETLESASMP